MAGAGDEATLVHHAILRLMPMRCSSQGANDSYQSIRGSALRVETLQLVVESDCQVAKPIQVADVIRQLLAPRPAACWAGVITA